jgi:hypothetical protein
MSEDVEEEAVGRIRDRVTYANVMSSLALFVALGGTSYALTLPRNSVGSDQIRARAVGASEIRRGAVRSNEVRDRSLGVRDLTLSARGSLRGATGPVGPQGPPGTPAVTFRAAVNSGGVIVRGNAIFKFMRGANEYLIGFSRPVDDCVSTATLAAVEGGGTPTPPAGRITVAREGGRVLVKTYNAAGNPEALPFHLIVAC